MSNMDMQGELKQFNKALKKQIDAILVDKTKALNYFENMFAIQGDDTAVVFSFCKETDNAPIILATAKDGDSAERILSIVTEKGKLVIYGERAATLSGIICADSDCVEFVVAPIRYWMPLARLMTEYHEEFFINDESSQKDGVPREDRDEYGPLVPLDPIRLELGIGLIPLVDKDKGDELSDRMNRLRREIGRDLGLAVKPIHIVDKAELGSEEYRIVFFDTEVGCGKLRMGLYLTINPDPDKIKEDIPGENVLDPTFGLPAKWVTEENKQRAKDAGLTVADCPAVVTIHLCEAIKQHANEFIGRYEASAMLKELRKENPVIVNEVLKHLSLGDIKQVLQNLLHEQVSIRNMPAILEACSDHAPMAKKAFAKNPVPYLVEKARQAIARQICLQYADENHVLHCLAIGPDLDKKIIDSGLQTTSGPFAAMEPALYRQWIMALDRACTTVREQGWVPVILCSERARRLVKQSTERQIPELVVLSVREIVKDVDCDMISEIRLENT